MGVKGAPMRAGIKRAGGHKYLPLAEDRREKGNGPSFRRGSIDSSPRAPTAPATHGIGATSSAEGTASPSLASTGPWHLRGRREKAGNNLGTRVRAVPHSTDHHADGKNGVVDIEQNRGHSESDGAERWGVGSFSSRQHSSRDDV